MSDITTTTDGRPLVTIYHNPQCSTSRTTLGLIREAGIEPQVIEYLKTPPGRTRLVELMQSAGLQARGLVRTNQDLFSALSLDTPGTADEAIIDAMAEHPILMNRPIVVTPKGVRLCRPADAVLEILP